MKKTTKKLSLNRETARELDQEKLNQAQGGAVGSVVSCYSGCPSSSMIASSC